MCIVNANFTYDQVMLPIDMLVVNLTRDDEEDVIEGHVEVV